MGAPVVVLGCRHGGLAAIRSLGRAGHRVIALSHRRDDFGFRSRFVDEVDVCPSPDDDDAFVAYLISRGARWPGALLLDTEDAYTRALSQHRDRLAEHFIVLAPPWPMARPFLEKDLTVELATRAGIDVPAAVSVAAGHDLDCVLATIPLPAVVKPVRSQELVDAFGVKLWVVATRHEMAQRLAAAEARGVEVVVQEIVPGDDTALESVEVYVGRSGQWLGEQYNVKIRQSPPGFGVMRVGRSVAPIPDVREATRRLLAEVDFRGYASAEFKRDPRDGRPKLIEVNVRLSRNGALMARSGADFPGLIYADLVEGIAVPVTNDVTPTTFIDFTADLGNLVTRDRSLLRHPVRALAPYRTKPRAEAVWSRSDVRPMVSMLATRVRRSKSTVRRA